MENYELLELIVSDLDALTDENDYINVSNGRNWADRVSGINASLRRIVSKSNFRMVRDDIYYFTGKIYEKIENKDILYMALKAHLRKYGVLEADIFQNFKRMLSEFFSTIRLKPKFLPKYNVQAYRNGVLNLTTLEFHDFSPEFDVIYLHDFDYDREADCPMWKSFLRQVLPEVASRAILQMYLGLCTLDRGSMFDKVENCLMLYGTGANGKSVIFETVSGIFGKENISNAGLGAMLKDGDERLRTMALIDGKIINVCPEIQAKSFAGNEDAFKSICSGEPQLARRIRENVYTVYNVPRLIFNMNNVPRSEDASLGFFRRFLYLVFEVTIPEEQQNKHLAEDLKAEYSGILNWIIRGAKLLEKNKYVFPASDNATRMMLKNMADKNIVLSWFRARGMRVEKATQNELCAWISCDDLMLDLEEYARINDFENVKSQTEFGRKMKDLGFTKMKGNKKVKSGEGTFYRIYGFGPERICVDVPVIMDDSLVKTNERAELPYDVEDL